MVLGFDSVSATTFGDLVRSPLGDLQATPEERGDFTPIIILITNSVLFNAPPGGNGYQNPEFLSVDNAFLASAVEQFVATDWAGNGRVKPVLRVAIFQVEYVGGITYDSPTFEIRIFSVNYGAGAAMLGRGFPLDPTVNATINLLFASERIRTYFPDLPDSIGEPSRPRADLNALWDRMSGGGQDKMQHWWTAEGLLADKNRQQFRLGSVTTMLGLSDPARNTVRDGGSRSDVVIRVDFGYLHWMDPSITDLEWAHLFHSSGQLGLRNRSSPAGGSKLQEIHTSARTVSGDNVVFKWEQDGWRWIRSLANRITELLPT